MSHKQFSSIRIRRSGRGYLAEGNGFYVWDDEKSVAVTTALELARGDLAGLSARRIVLHPAGAGAASLWDGEALDA